MAVTPTYPGGILPWVNRIDKTNIVLANDPNTLAADLIAVESTLGTNPQIEAAPPIGTQVTYKNVSARIHDVQMGNQVPVVTLYSSSYTVKFLNWNYQLVTYNKLLDNFGFHNGRDLTVQAPGWYIVTIDQTHEWASAGWFDVHFLVNGNKTAKHRWHWDFPSNNPRSPGFNQEQAWQNFTWQGVLHAGDRLSVANTNYTSKSLINVTNAYLRASWIRSVPPAING